MTAQRTIVACALAGLVAACAVGTSVPSESATQPPTAAPTGTPAAAIDPSELTGTILFGRAGGEYGDATIFTASASGANDLRVGGYLADKTTCCPRWTPDGSRMAFPALTPDERFTTAFVNPDGSDPVLFDLPEGFQGACMTASRSGDRLACEAAGSAGNGIYTVRASDGGDPQPVITGDTAGIPMDFSPDGTQIVFVGEAVGPPTGVEAPVGSLFVINVDGSGLIRITPEGVYGTGTARWSPDGQWIVFGGLAESGDPLWAVHPDGSDFHEVFTDAQGRGAGCAIWSPDGKFILFCLNPPGSLATLSEAPSNGLYVIRADGTDLTPVIVTDDFKVTPDWTAGD